VGNIDDLNWAASPERWAVWSSAGKEKNLNFMLPLKKLKTLPLSWFKRINFLIYLNINPELVLSLPSIARDVRYIGH
jgi:hypothetical protein